MTKGGCATIYLEPKRLYMHVEFENLKNAKLSGSKTQDDYYLLEKLEEVPLKFQDSIDVLYEKYYDQMDATKDSLILDGLNQKINSLDVLFAKNTESKILIDLDFIKHNPLSFVSLNTLSFILGSQDLKYFDILTSLNSGLNETVRNSESGKKLQKKLDVIGSNRAGSIAPDFTVKDINGDVLDLYSFKNKSCVLLEFWASWCAPCREGIPDLKKMYSQYNDKGFEIICITIDKNLDLWRKAILKDDVSNWKHFSITENPFVSKKAYFIQGIPQKILINKEGIIVGRWIGESAENLTDIKNMLSLIFDK